MTAKGAHYRADIQGLRGVAVLLVVAFHVGLPVRGGFVGVDVFFVISGFVITRLLVDELDLTGRVDLPRFYGRRIRRLLPALALMLLTITVASAALCALGTLDLTARTAASAALIFANMFLYRSGGGGYFDEASGSNPLLHTWSLSLEEQFYLFFPGLLAIGWWLGRRYRYSPRTVALALVLFTCTVSFALCVLMTGGGGPHRIGNPRSLAFYSAPTRAWEFGAGAIVALIGARLPPSAAARHIASLCGGLLVAGAAVAYGPQTPFPGVFALAPVVGTGLLLASSGGGAARILEWPLLVRLGDISYSWYLWHWPLIVFAPSLFPSATGVVRVLAVLSLGAAWVSYVAVEAPLRSWNPGPSGRMVALALGCVGLPLLGAAALEGANRVLAKSKNIAAYAYATRRHVDSTADCTGGPLGSRPQTNCVWPSSSPVGRIVLIGDSNAGQFAEPVVGAAQSSGHSVELATKPSCPFVDVVLRRAGIEQAACREFFEASMKALIAKPPALVIIASASDSYVRTEQWTLAKPGTDQWQQGADGKGALWATQLESTLRSLHDTGARVLVVHPIPKLGPWRASSCAVGLVAFWPQACRASRSRDAVILDRLGALQAERASTAATGTQTLDLALDICPDSTCQAWRDGIYWYRDGGHLGVDGALALTPQFRRAIAAALSKTM